MFGDLTTLTLGWGRSRDGVGENNGTAFVPVIAWLGHAETQTYDVGLSQILTKNLIAGAALEVDTDNGYLANPYRSIRYLDSQNPKGYSLGSPVFPDTRTSTAIQVQAKYYLPYRAAVTGSYRYFSDTWGIVGNTYELDYTHPIANVWILEGRVRYYKQNSANFYSDLYPQANYQNFEGARPESGGLGKHHHRSQGHLRVPTQRLEDFQTGDRHVRRQPHFLPLSRLPQHQVLRRAAVPAGR